MRHGPEVRSPADAVALPMALLDRQTAAGPVRLVWSTVREPVLVLGRAAGRPPVNDAAVRRRGVTVATRRSGGAPVLWDPGLVALDVVLPAGHPLVRHDVTDSYRWLGEVVRAALTRLGVPCSVVDLTAARSLQARTDDVSRVAARACFGGVSPYEVLAVDGRKVVGLSQARRRTGALLQCGVVLRFDAGGLADLLEADPVEARALTGALAARAAGIVDWVPDATAADVVDCVEEALRTTLGVQLVASGR